MIRKLWAKLKVIALHYRTMGVANATSYIIQRLYKDKAFLSARIKNTDLRILLRNDPYDTQIFTQIFIRDELNIQLDEAPDVIIDGGANIGLATLYLKTRYPDATVIAIEPERSNFELLVENTRGYNDVFCLNNGIWNRNCRLRIVDNGDGNASFTTTELGDDETATEVIDAITISDVISRFHLDRLNLVKLDIEGSEKAVFEANHEEWLSKTDHVIVEIHPHLHPDCEMTVTSAFARDFVATRSGEYSVFSRKRPG